MTATRRAAVAVGLAVAAIGCRSERAAPNVAEQLRAVKVARGEIIDRVILTGELRSSSSAAIVVPRTESFQLAIRWLAEDGALVSAGDRVVEFDNSAVTSQLESKRMALIDAEMTLKTARDLAAIETASKGTELRQRQIALEKATVRAGVPADLMPQRDVQERQLEKKRAEIAVVKAEQQLAAQREESALDLRIKQIAVDKARAAIETAERTIAELVGKAPREGLIVLENHPWLGRKIQLGDTVQPGMTIASLPDMTQPMEVRAELSDVDDGRVAVGMAGECTLDAFPRDPIRCTVAEVTPVARTRDEASLRRAFTVRLSLAKPDPARMRPGMSVKVELRRAVAQAGALIVPRSAVVVPEAAARAARADRGREVQQARVRMASGQLRDVTLGACDARACAVDVGLVEGDAVLIEGAT